MARAVDDAGSGSEARHIVMTGLMASGKSTVGALVAARLGLSLVDNDEVLTGSCGLTARAFEAAHGRDRLHRREFAALRLCLWRCAPSVVTAAASVAERPDLLSTLVARHDVVFLDAPAAVLARRARSSRASEAGDTGAGGDHRPVRGTAGMEAMLASQRARRSPVYRHVARVVVDVSASAPLDTAEQILRELGRLPDC